MKTHTIGIIMNGVTGRMGTNQHLIRSILAIRDQGGVRVSPDETIMPEPVLLGRNPTKLAKLSVAHGDLPYSTDLDELLADERYTLYFDAQTTDRRYEAVKRAIEAGKHVYCEKPTATTAHEAIELYKLAIEAGVKHGVVQDKLWLPGLRKLKFLIDSGFFGRILSVRGDFGYWVFPGDQQPCQRPSWNYRKDEGGGILLDMLSHWRYVIDNLFGNITAFMCLGATHITERWDEQGKPYAATAEDAAYAMFLTDRNIVCQWNSSWCTRVRRDDLLTIHVDGMKGSAVVGLREVYVQHDAMTPRPVWNPDVPSPLDYFDGWSRVPDTQEYDNAFKAEWELFLRHVALDEPFRWDLREGAKGVQLAEMAAEASEKRVWLDLPEI
ncbi:MAG TPA: Gfo/Idh/MocA family oxidoreductase [Candidatus Hydrogenedentes bacterium]|nr:Gfo/Idh/MocA family oxidoreductase [Candidatus Hydrogenedentota bacterium]